MYMLENPMNVRAKKERRHEGRKDGENYPYIHIEKHPEQREQYIALFGVKLSTLIDRCETEGRRLSDAIYDQYKFIQCLLDGSHDQVIELRYHATPDSQNWTRGRLDISLIAGSGSKSAQEARRTAERMYENLASVMAVESENFNFQAIKEGKEFNSKWKPFEFNDVVEIVRMEDVTEFFCHVSPFVLQPTDLSRLCKALLMQKEPVIYSITLRSVNLTEEEKSYIRNPAKETGAAIGFTSSGKSEPQDLKLPQNSDKAEYLMKINLASSGTIPSSLIDLIGSEITAPARYEDGRNFEDGRYKGGYSWYRPQNSEDLESAVKALNYREFKALAPSKLPERMKRIRYVFDPAQAVSAFRFPVALNGKEIPGIDTKSYMPALSPELPKEGVLLGVSRHGTSATEVRLADEDRRKHTYIQGATGTGKTTLITSMALNDIYAGKGVIVIDYTGDLCLELLKRLPRERANDLVYFNPADTKHPIGFNPLAYDTSSQFRELQKENIVSSIISWLKREYEKDAMGPIFFQCVRNALLLAMADDTEEATIMDFLEVFYKKGARDSKYVKLKNPMVKMFWDEVFNSDRFKNASDNGVTLFQYIISKFSPLVDSEMTRNIFCQKKSKLDMREIIDIRKILLCNFSKGLIGEFNSKFLGLMTLFKIEQAALSRADIPEDKRMDSYIYLDECQNLQTEHFYNLLSEMRKYRLNITLANQHFSQLNDKMRDAIMGNCSTMIIFKTGIKDAEMLEPMLYPHKKELALRIPKYHALVRMQVKEEVKTFTMETMPVRVEPDEEVMKLAVMMSQIKYG